MPRPIWLGLKYIAAEEAWRWADGTVHNMTSGWQPWKNPIASPLYTDHCVLMVENERGDLEWVLEDCRAQVAFVVCTKKATTGDGMDVDWLLVGDRWRIQPFSFQ